jgi:hypothetical protein
MIRDSADGITICGPFASVDVIMKKRQSQADLPRKLPWGNHRLYGTARHRVVIALGKVVTLQRSEPETRQ